MLKNSKVKTVEHIVNLTEKPIFLYENSTGEILSFLPVDNRLEELTHRNNGYLCVYYVVETELVAELDRSGRRLDDIVVVHDTGIGRDGITISFLRLAVDNDVVVHYRRATVLNAV